MAFPFSAFSLIVVLCPCFALGGLPRKLMQGVAQRFNAAQSAMRFGIHATLIEDRRGSSQCLLPNAGGLPAGRAEGHFR